MVENIIAVTVGLGFFVTGMLTLIWPAEVRRWRARYNERFALFYSKNTLWDGKESIVHLFYRVGGAIFAVIGFVILYEILLP